MVLMSGSTGSLFLNTALLFMIFMVLMDVDFVLLVAWLDYIEVNLVLIIFMFICLGFWFASCCCLDLMLWSLIISWMLRAFGRDLRSLAESEVIGSSRAAAGEIRFLSPRSSGRLRSSRRELPSLICSAESLVGEMRHESGSLSSGILSSEALTLYRSIPGTCTASFT